MIKHFQIIGQNNLPYLVELDCYGESNYDWILDIVIVFFSVAIVVGLLVGWRL
jgi:hypothetical protein